LISGLTEGATLTLPATTILVALPDSAAKAFRAAAGEHLARINPGRDDHLWPACRSPWTTCGRRCSRRRSRGDIGGAARSIVSIGVNAIAPVDTPSSATVGIDVIMAAPKFRQAMYEPLRDLSQDLLLPGLETVPADAVLGLKTNRRFVEAYMVGLNVEMAHELLWRGFPTDQRGTCFDQFWDVRASPKPRPDINPLHQWANRPLADAQTAPVREQFVMLMRTALLRRYPNAIIYATPAVLTNGVRSPNLDPAQEVHAAFPVAAARFLLRLRPHDRQSDGKRRHARLHRDQEHPPSRCRCRRRRECKPPCGGCGTAAGLAARRLAVGTQRRAHGRHHAAIAGAHSHPRFAICRGCVTRRATMAYRHFNDNRVAAARFHGK
jgi:hypothetical protein